MNVTQLRTTGPLRTSTPPRSLPVAVHPGAGEAFHSLTLRLAARLGVEPVRALKACGFVTSSARGRAELTAYGLTATDDAIAEMARTTRATETALRDTLLNVYDGGPIDFTGYTPDKPGAVRRLAVLNWVNLGTSSCCPDCLRQSGYQWQLTWRLPWHMMCTTHEALMAANCPACGMPFNAGSRRDGTLGPRTSNLPIPLDRCGNPLDLDHRTPYPPLCRHPYADIPTVACTQPAVVATQTAIDTMLTVAHRRQHHPWWHDLRVVTAVLLTHGEPVALRAHLPGLPAEAYNAAAAHFADRDRVDAERADIQSSGGDHRTASRRRTYWETPDNPALMATILPVALAVLQDLNHLPEPLVGTPSPLPDVDAARLLTDLVRSRGHNLPTQLRQRGASDALTSQLLARSRYNPLGRSAPSVIGSLPTSAIPRLYPWHLYEPVRDLMRSTGTTDDYARAYLSLCAAKLVTGGTWEAAAEALDWDGHTGKVCANAVTIRLNQAGQRELVHQHVLDTMGSLDTGIDYRHLADVHGRVTEIPADEWDEAAAAAGLDVKPTAARRRNLAAWRWHNIALMPLSEWPGWRHCTNLTSAKEVYRKFARLATMPHRSWGVVGSGATAYGYD